MSFWNIVKSLNYRKIFRVFVWFLQHPLFMFATVKATFLTIRIAQIEFPDIHGKHNKANAFRHALWNLLIANQSNKFSTNLEAVIAWTKKITDWHEEFSPNMEMAKLMDLHNNAIGRQLYIDWQEQSLTTYIDLLKTALSKATIVTHKSDFKNLKNNLIYLRK
ncbi:MULTISPECIES: DUF6973 domain-containing protein [unclassified Polaribacter]|uniref:DUF6973 domain-containing protein n=1 Tax=unclassified Polaribacter TaxID=196858 RepID=UPI0011BF7D7D|nr:MULTISPECIES: hypothetical protein [unclassified Polaribacter]TXD53621.1 hypothetical protein ES043_03080 [Polaribacter sp. IC063]TXD62139.1 hypothetical protein ES044_02625 [Polaribacter sp. IC066]